MLLTQNNYESMVKRGKMCSSLVTKLIIAIVYKTTQVKDKQGDADAFHLKYEHLVDFSFFNKAYAQFYKLSLSYLA